MGRQVLMRKEKTLLQKINRKADKSKANNEASDPFDAKECLENGVTATVGRYLRDEVAPLLRSLSNPEQQRDIVGDLSAPDPDQPFEFNTADVLWAIKSGKSELHARYPGELAKAISLLGDMLDPNGRSEFCLEAKRRRKGRPREASFVDLEGRIVRELKFARLRADGKLEAALSEVGTRSKLSRSTLFRIWARRNGSRRP
jgi:hypothetical protein